MSILAEPEHSTNLASVRLRPDKGNWGVMVFFAVIGLTPLLLLFGMPRPINIAGVALAGSSGGMLFIPAVLFGIWQARAEVIADDTGIRWRGLGGWQRANWANVNDYYERLLPQSKPMLVIETTGKRLSLTPNLWESNPDFKAVIERHATRARAKQWGILGMRPDVDEFRVCDDSTTDKTRKNGKWKSDGRRVTVAHQTGDKDTP